MWEGLHAQARGQDVVRLSYDIYARSSFNTASVPIDLEMYVSSILPCKRN